MCEGYAFISQKSKNTKFTKWYLNKVNATDFSIILTYLQYIFHHYCVFFVYSLHLPSLKNGWHWRQCDIIRKKRRAHDKLGEQATHKGNRLNWESKTNSKEYFPLNVACNDRHIVHANGINNQKWFYWISHICS